MAIVIVPKQLRDAIYLGMEMAFRQVPEPYWPSSENWEAVYSELLAYYDEHGIIPDFSLERRPHGQA